MKKLLLLLSITFSILSFGQDTEFSFKKEGFTDYVVMPVEGKTASELYKKTLDWIQVTYNTPSEVLKGQVENDYIRIEGSKIQGLCTKTLGLTNCNMVRYQIEISLKDGKYKFDVISVEQYVKGTQYVTGGWYPIAINDVSWAFNKKGEVRGAYKEYGPALENIFNDLNKSLNGFINSKVEVKKSDW